MSRVPVGARKDIRARLAGPHEPRVSAHGSAVGTPRGSGGVLDWAPARDGEVPHPHRRNRDAPVRARRTWPPAPTRLNEKGSRQVERSNSSNEPGTRPPACPRGASPTCRRVVRPTSRPRAVAIADRVVQHLGTRAPPVGTAPSRTLPGLSRRVQRADEVVDGAPRSRGSLRRCAGARASGGQPCCSIRGP